MGASTNYELSEAVIRRALEKGVTLGCAESCTGGMVCAALTDVAGSSAVIKGGVVSYAVPIKERLLKVPTEITRNPQVGVVSSECAQRMSEGAREALECDVAVSVTGIAGPGGAEPGKPVGTVWFGISSDAGTITTLKHFEGDRHAVREQAVACALNLFLEQLS